MWKIQEPMARECVGCVSVIPETMRVLVVCLCSIGFFVDFFWCSIPETISGFFFWMFHMVVVLLLWSFFIPENEWDEL